MIGQMKKIPGSFFNAFVLKMSCSYQLIVVIGYELVSYLLFYSSARCVTFKRTLRMQK